MRTLLSTLILALAWTGVFGAGPETGPEPRDVLSGDLVVFHAGSLSVPFKEVSAEFMRRHPGVKVLAEAAGSRDSARKISELGRPCDVFGTADYDVTESLLMPGFADFNIVFATNRLGLAYTSKSRRADAIGPKNWHKILLEDGVNFGRADPDSDPCGYRTLMAFHLAEKHYKSPGLAQRLAAKDGRRFIRPKETDLLALLEAGEIDYLFIYRSVIEQHGLKSVALPEGVDLGSASRAADYAQVSVEVSGKRPGERMTIKALPILYAVTIPKDAPNRAAAEAYVAFLLGPEGQALMKKNGQAPVSPALTKEPERVPAAFRKLCRKWR